MAKIPEHAKCVFKGILFDTYQWQQELYDGSFTTFEMLKRKHVISVIALQDENIFYLEEQQPDKDPFIGLVSGCADNNSEDPLETAKRELLEETGMASDDWSLIMESNDNPFIDCPIYIYTARNCRVIAEPTLEPSEKIDVHIATIDKFCDEILVGDSFQIHHPLRVGLLTETNKEKMTKLKDLLKKA
ncbi:MAG: NUDIX hydrolase [Proteobacteria bacterium]|nr:NUDIX hydrolase [Pseudomonadota bacterium]